METPNEYKDIILLFDMAKEQRKQAKCFQNEMSDRLYYLLIKTEYEPYFGYILKYMSVLKTCMSNPDRIVFCHRYFTIGGKQMDEKYLNLAKALRMLKYQKNIAFVSGNVSVNISEEMQNKICNIFEAEYCRLGMNNRPIGMYIGDKYYDFKCSKNPSDDVQVEITESQIKEQISVWEEQLKDSEEKVKGYLTGKRVKNIIPYAIVLYFAILKNGKLTDSDYRLIYQVCSFVGVLNADVLYSKHSEQDRMKYGMQYIKSIYKYAKNYELAICAQKYLPEQLRTNYKFA